MRKRSKYRPKPVLADPLAYVLESSGLIKDEHPAYLVKWQLNVNQAFGALLKGYASKHDLHVMSGAMNLCESIMKLKKMSDDGTLKQAEQSLIALTDRANQGKGLTMKAAEIQSMRDIVQIHDELLGLVSVREFDQALAYAKREAQAGRTITLKEPA